MNLINIILLVGAIQGLILTLLIYKKNEIIFHKLLSSIIFIISFALLIAYFQNTLDLTKYAFLIKTNILFSLLFVPLLLLYLKKITGSLTKNKFKNFLLFIPFAIVLVYNIPFYFSDFNTKIEFYINELNFTPSISAKIEEVFIQFSITIFGFLAILDVKSYSQRVDNFFSSHEKAKINWIKTIAFSMFILSLFALLISIAQFFISEIPMFIQFATAMASTVIIYYIAYFFLLHPNALVDVSEKINTYVAKEDDVKLSVNENIKKTNINSDFEKKILELLETQKVYTNPEITINEIAEKIGIPAYLTSKIINQNLNTNFFNLINKYRIEQVKNELLSSNNKTIIETAYQAGFNSKTTFYEVFKKNTGVSPSEFIKQNKSAIQSDKNNQSD